MQNHRRTGTLYCIEDCGLAKKGDALVWTDKPNYYGTYTGYWLRQEHSSFFQSLHNAAPDSQIHPSRVNTLADRFARKPPAGFPKVTDDAYRYEDGQCIVCGAELATYTQKLVLQGQLPSLNDMLDARGRRGRRGRGGRQVNLYSAWKKDIEAIIVLEARAQGIRPVTFKTRGRKIVPIRPKVTFYEPDEKRDVDNIVAAQKFIWDALVAAGILPADGRKYLACPLLEVLVDREHPRVEVELP